MSTENGELIAEARRKLAVMRANLGYEGTGDLIGDLADALETATKPVTVSDADVIAALPDRTVAIDKFGDVLHYRGCLWCSYESAPFDSEYIARKFAPLTVIYEPRQAVSNG